MRLFTRYSRLCSGLRVRGIQESLGLAIKPEKVKKPGPSGLRRGATIYEPTVTMLF